MHTDFFGFEKRNGDAPEVLVRDAETDTGINYSVIRIESKVEGKLTLFFDSLDDIETLATFLRTKARQMKAAKRRAEAKEVQA